MFSPSFQDAENRKHIVALAEHLDITVIAPAEWRLPSDDFRVGGAAESEYALEHFMALPAVRPFGYGLPQYGLRSLSFGFRKAPPDVIHIDHDPWAPLFWQALASRRLFAPSARVVMSPKKNTYRHHEGRAGALKLGMALRGLRHVDFLMPASAMARDLYRDRFGVPEERMQVTTYVPVDTDALSPAREPGAMAAVPVIGFSGRWHPQKGLMDLVAAVDRCHAAGRPMVVRAIGSGPEAAELDRLAAERPWLELRGPLPLREVAGFLRDVDIFAAPARIEPDHQEHDGHAVLQALAAGLPVVGTRSGIIPELLGDGVGVLVDPEDPEGLAQALMALVADDARRATLAATARAVAVQRYAIAPVTARKVAVYERVAGAAAPARRQGL